MVHDERKSTGVHENARKGIVQLEGTGKSTERACARRKSMDAGMDVATNGGHLTIDDGMNAKTEG